MSDLSDELVRHKVAIEIKAVSATDMRQPNQLFEQLKDNPFGVLRVEKYGQSVAFILSPTCFDALISEGEGDYASLSLPIEGTDYEKSVQVVRHYNGEELRQRWEVTVDGVLYKMTGPWWSPLGTSTEQDMEQLIWRHHPDVARRVLERFAWSGSMLQNANSNLLKYVQNVEHVLPRIDSLLDKVHITADSIAMEIDDGTKCYLEEYSSVDMLMIDLLSYAESLLIHDELPAPLWVSYEAAHYTMKRLHERFDSLLRQRFDGELPVVEYYLETHGIFYDLESRETLPELMTGLYSYSKLKQHLEDDDLPF